MIVTIEEVKLYLRVDNDLEDTLIIDFINTAEELIEGILRYPLTEFEEIPEAVKTTVLFIVSNMYEKREDVNIKDLLDTAKNLLFNYRKESW